MRARHSRYRWQSCRTLVAGQALIAVLAVAACSTAPKKPSPASPPAPRTSGLYKVGKPYVINGVWYTPRVDYAYRENGIASWYGPGFHGQATANGEIYDMNDLTAAHKTLPLPSIVRVTNLDNGRALKLRVNDRGPFVAGRIIDVSRRGAQLLGFYGQGTANVQVEIVADESRQLALALTGAADAGQEVAELTPVAPPPPPLPANDTVSAASSESSAETAVSVAESEPAPTTTVTRTYVQVGAFAQPSNAWRARERLSRLGYVQIRASTAAGRDLYKVHLGPYASNAEAEQVLAEVVREGFGNPRLVLE